MMDRPIYEWGDGEERMPRHFAVGDRVIALDEQVAGVLVGTVGTIVHVFARMPEICDVAFDGHEGLRAVFTSALDPAPPPNAPAPEST
jgi:hypothetical protein